MRRLKKAHLRCLSSLRRGLRCGRECSRINDTLRFPVLARLASEPFSTVSEFFNGDRQENDACLRWGDVDCNVVNVLKLVTCHSSLGTIYRLLFTINRHQVSK